MMRSDSPEFSRNLGFLHETEQARLHNASVAIAGAGGDGGMLALQLARLGVGELRLADPDPFEAENINRQACCTQQTVGCNKAEAVGDYIEAINPSIQVTRYTDGITENNVETFVRDADLLIDETEFTMHTLGVMLARTARAHKVPNLMAMNIGFGATVTSFNPEHGMTFEKMLGLSETASLSTIATSEPAISGWLPYIPPYADLTVFKKVATNEKSAPSIAPGVALAASMAATQAMLHLVGTDNNRQKPVEAPNILVMDALTGMGRQMRITKRAHYSSLAKMVTRNVLGHNPRASY